MAANDITFEDARSVIRAALEPLGLGRLTFWAWNQIVKPAGDIDIGISNLMLELPETDAFKKRFPVYQELVDAGTPMSPAQIVAFENQATAIFRSAGIPEGFYDTHGEIQQWLRGDVGVAVTEIQSRIELAQQSADAAFETRQELRRLYGLSRGELTAFFLDPNKALPIVQRQFTNAQISGASRRVGFGRLTRQEAGRLRAAGFDEATAGQALGELAGQAGLFEATQGEQRAGGSISRETQLGAVTGDEGARRRIRRQRERRIGEFAGAAGFGVGEEGVTGLG